MKKFNKNIGNYGETLAKDFLISQNHILIEKNFKYKNGEIDLISKKDNILIFTEVKLRTTLNFGRPIEAVSYTKVKNIIKTAKFYIHKNFLYNYFIRFDIIEILYNVEKNNYKINHLKDAFREL